MKILSIPIVVHDASICVLEDGKITSYEVEERLSRNKHDLDIIFILETLKGQHFDKVIITDFFPSYYTQPLKIVKEKIKDISYDELIIKSGEHHLYHAYSGFYNSGFDEALCFSIDGTGAVNSDNFVELETAYILRKNQKEQKLYQKNRKYQNFGANGRFFENISSIDESYLSHGEIYQKYSQIVESTPLDGPGKLTGLGQYKNYKEKLKHPYNSNEWKKRVDIANDIQKRTQSNILNTIKKYVSETGIRNIVISGGYGLNCVANYYFLKNLNDINLYIDPICFDAGISIGVAYYYCNSTLDPLQNVYIVGKSESYNLEGLSTKKVSYNDVVDLLLEQNIVAIFQGKSEAGQRALGNRSLLFDPRNPKGKDIVNQIKRRENYRPFAGTILQEEAHKWFNMISLNESPYMQYAMDAYENAIQQVPAIIHADNTCRIQTVTHKQNQHFYNLISSFFDKTGVPMLMNTSFNLGGEPLVQTFDHAISTIRNSMVEYLYLPEIETLVTINNPEILYR